MSILFSIIELAGALALLAALAVLVTLSRIGRDIDDD
jgi:hypothetical protein